jgi:hypothetical protein
MQLRAAAEMQHEFSRNSYELYDILCKLERHVAAGDSTGKTLLYEATQRLKAMIELVKQATAAA